jgi:hypothetical protein
MPEFGTAPGVDFRVRSTRTSIEREPIEMTFLSIAHQTG